MKRTDHRGTSRKFACGALPPDAVRRHQPRTLRVTDVGCLADVRCAKIPNERTIVSEMQRNVPTSSHQCSFGDRRNRR